MLSFIHKLILKMQIGILTMKYFHKKANNKFNLGLKSILLNDIKGIPEKICENITLNEDNEKSIT